MNARSSGLPILGALALAVMHPPGGSPALKCSGTRAEALVVVNGTFVDTTLSELGLEPAEVFQADIVCMDPADSSFNRQKGIPVVSIWTHDGPAPQMAAALEKVLEAQTEHHEQVGAYLDDVESVDLSAFPPEVEVSIRASEAGWVAVARLERFMSGCLIYDGGIQPPHPTVDQGKPRYLPIEDLPKNLGRVVERRRPK